MLEYIIERLSNRKPGILDESDYDISAVLLPLIEKHGKVHVLFEVRSESLDWQPGEICFPGGRLETYKEQDPQKTALRETAEELGIIDEQIQLIGPLDVLLTPFGKLIYPYAGKIIADRIKPNVEEVKEIFMVPVDFFLNNPPSKTHVDVATQYGKNFPLDKVPSTYRSGWWKRWAFPMYFFQYEKYFIWGLTARVLVNFIKLCWPDNVNYNSLIKTGG